MYEEIPKDYVTVVWQNSNTMRFRLSCQADDRIKGYGEITFLYQKCSIREKKIRYVCWKKF